MPEEMITIGIVTRPHGVKGEVRVLPLTDYPERFEELDRVFLTPPEDSVINFSGSIDLWSLATDGLKIEKVGYHKNQIIIKFMGIDDRLKAEELKNLEIKIPLAERIQLPENHYFISEIVGLNVFTEEGRSLGKIVDVITTAGNDVYVVGKAGLMIPAIKEVVKKIDLKEGRMVVKLIEGLEDLSVN